jgi:CubicO group peptidase (beta-lactamase class C family)
MVRIPGCTGVISRLLAAVLLLATPVFADEPFEWPAAEPSTQGFSPEELDALRDAIADRTQALLVIRNDRLVCEWYAAGREAGDKHGTASLAKAIVGGLSLAVAMDEGRITLDDPAWKFVPQWRDDAVRSQITIRHLGSHTSGIDDSHNREERARGVDQGSYTGWAGDFWRWRNGDQPAPHDAFTISRDRAPVLFEPGSDYQYSNPGIAMLAWCVTASLKDSMHADIRSLLRERVMRPIGVADREWSCGYGLTEEVDGLPLVANWGGGSYTPRAVARIGRLVLRRGDWDGARLLSAEAVDAITQDAGLPGHFGMGWWTNADGHFKELPRDAVWGAGAGHQILLVVPSLGLIVVRNGGALPGDGPERSTRDPLYVHLFQPLMAALTDRHEDEPPGTPMPSGESGVDAQPQPPYPPSSVIKRVEWAPLTDIVRAAAGSDNWPLTWGDDDRLYTAYGDGRGFEPFVPSKLSLGFAAVEGPPDSFRGFNIRSETGEDTGDDVRGRKASGLLMLDGTLYVLVRNAGNAQLGWSDDHARTWRWAGWKLTTSFGCPTFINYGRDYSGAPDPFVYIVSSDSDSAYEPADRMVLARAPRDRLRDADAWEYFERPGADGRPVWTVDVAERGSIFDHPARCYRGGLTWNAGLKRYLWCQVFPESTDSRGPRFQGGFGIFDAPQPWGPWTTAYFTNNWDTGPGESSSFPARWISENGLTAHLVFSGNDHFCVRQARFVPADPPE